MIKWDYLKSYIVEVRVERIKNDYLKYFLFDDMVESGNDKAMTILLSKFIYHKNNVLIKIF